MKIIISKQIHSSSSSFSSDDKFLYSIFNPKQIDFKYETMRENNLIKSKKIQYLNNEIVKEVSTDKETTIFYLKADEKFYHGSPFLSTSSPIGFEEHVKSFLLKGWQTTTQPQELKEFYNRSAEIEIQERKKAGYVLWKKYEDFTPSDFQGGFSKSLFNDKELQSYVKNGGVFGYIGHSVRKPVLDKVLETELKLLGLDESHIACYLSSSDGRHFGDALEGYHLKEQIQTIKKNAKSIYNISKIYNHPEHTGSRESTEKIEKKLKLQGELL